jgi:hypothetical protein
MIGIPSGHGFDRLSLIVTRLDADEAADPIGAYHFTFDSTADSAD